MKSDAEFARALAASTGTVAAVAAWMAAGHCDVLVRPTAFRPGFEDRHAYADDGDIEIRQRVEVKRRSVPFTSADDYPFPTVFVDERHKVDRVPRARLWGYLIVNRDGTHACCVRPDTRDRWETVRRYDAKDRQHREFYACPVDLCSFHALRTP